MPLNLYHIGQAVTFVTDLIYLFNNIAVGYIPPVFFYFFQRLMMTLHRQIIYVNGGAAVKSMTNKKTSHILVFILRFSVDIRNERERNRFAIN
jgi:hypothetical protein